MALYVPPETVDKEKQFTIEYPSFPIATDEQESYRFKRNQHLKQDLFTDTRNGSFVRNFLTEMDGYYEKIKPTGFSINDPWLPPNAVKLLNKIEKTSIAETELLRLMELIAERASIHFQLTKGRFVAMTFHGRVVEVSDSRVDLLKRIQGRKYSEQIFVWKIGSKAFSGRI